MNQGFTPHELVWTREATARFWNHLASGGLREEIYFSRQFGDAIVQFASTHAGLQGEVLDFGCGPGYLIEKLIARGVTCTGLDFSVDSVHAVREHLGVNPLLREVILAEDLPSPLPANFFDTVFLIETVEHLLPGDLSGTLTEIGRLLRPGGHLILTTPNDENLEARKVICPDCGAIFHRMQHISSWTLASLAALMAQYDFEVVVNRAVTLRARSILNPLRELMARRRGDEPPHLICVACKKGV